MQESTTGVGQKRAPGHGLTIVEAGLPPSWGLRASCLCGWLSDVAPGRSDAVALGREHLFRIATIETAQLAKVSVKGDAVASVVCVPWCIDGTGHPNSMFRDDQWCYGEERHVELERPQPLGDKFGPPYMSTYSRASQGYSPFVSVSYSGGIEVQLTAGEARRVAADLMLAADEVEQEAPTGQSSE